jgi:type IV pilus assembly protein PilA
MFCQNCGTTNPDSGQFCSQCGSPLTAAAAVRPTTGPGAVSGSSFATPPPLVGNPPTSGKAIASLICGIFTFFFPASIAAIILGHVSLSEIRGSAGRLGGRGLATTGLVLGYLGLMIIPVTIVAAIAIPNLLHARVAANEASAVGSLRVINTAAISYAATFENGFPSSLDVLGSAPGGESACKHASLIDAPLASGRKSGYVFTYTPVFPGNSAAPVISPKAAAKGCTAGGASGYTVTADPMQRGTTGRRSFYTDQSGIIRFSGNGESATANSLPLYQR